MASLSSRNGEIDTGWRLPFLSVPCSLLTKNGLMMAEDGSTANCPDVGQESNNFATQEEAGNREVPDSSSVAPTVEKVKENRKKVDVLLKATGDAPIMKKKKWAVDKNKQVSYLIDFIRKYIKCDPSESLFLYVNQTFVPPPDQLISNLYECFGTDGKLVLHYCKTQAWG